MTQTLLFDEDNSDKTSAQCSAEAREKVDAARLERLTEQEFLLFPGGATADEIVHRLQGMGLNVDYLSIRPRVSELKARGVLLTTGALRNNRKGNTCAVLRHVNFTTEGK